ncbi:tyrosine-type recombinase/integrase [Skermanella rosea]|uniref:Tyrosine-type recombinase/integrase n=1 Tax=Skermanella cutis TaxID=2775420 RepID=A0ABX7B535_9PROT|nr:MULTISPECIES: tyrosine-type recombinase/integrase [Skermanella]QQP89458.1 tyrosine-type recombinase/integrase [Skermanella sp. TT6]UEM03612.1 tyrosine-type recombinase/integrase [Skermanella rosea]
MEIVFTRRNMLEKDLDPEILGHDFETIWQTQLRPIALRTLDARGIDDRVPFILDDRLSCDETLSGVMLELSSLIAGRTTMESYARHAFRFLRYLQRRSKTLSELDNTTLSDYKRYRLKTDGIEERSWNAEAAALKRFFDACVLREILPRNPVNMPLFAWAIRSAAAAPERAKFITLAQFKKFRDEGLARGRYGSRNIAYADLLLTTGLRLDEGNGFRDSDIPKPAAAMPPSTGKGFNHRVRPEVAKGSKGRKVRISPKCENSLLFYRDLLRVDQVARGKRVGLYDRPPHEFWLNQSNLPMSGNGWEFVFRRASHLAGVEATPHTLRHTFAIYTLSKLIQHNHESVARAQEEARKLTSECAGYSAKTLYDTILGDPLRRLQKLLGHSSYESTFIYIDLLAEDFPIDEILEVFHGAIDSEVEYGCGE